MYSILKFLCTGHQNFIVKLLSAFMHHTNNTNCGNKLNPQICFTKHFFKATKGKNFCGIPMLKHKMDTLIRLSLQKFHSLG